MIRALYIVLILLSFSSSLKAQNEEDTVRLELVFFSDNIKINVDKVLDILLSNDKFINAHTIEVDVSKGDNLYSLLTKRNIYYANSREPSLFLEKNPRIESPSKLRVGDKLNLIDLPIRFERTLGLLGITNSIVTKHKVKTAIEKYHQKNDENDLEEIISNAAGEKISFQEVAVLNDDFEEGYFKELRSGLFAQAIVYPKLSAYMTVEVPSVLYPRLRKLMENPVNSGEHSSVLVLKSSVDMWEANSASAYGRSTKVHSKHQKVCGKDVLVTSLDTTRNVDINEYLDSVKSYTSLTKRVSELLSYNSVDLAIIDFKFPNTVHKLSQLPAQSKRHSTFYLNHNIVEQKIEFDFMSRQYLSEEELMVENHGSHLKTLAEVVLPELIYCDSSSLSTENEVLKEGGAGLFDLLKIVEDKKVYSISISLSEDFKNDETVLKAFADNIVKLVNSKKKSLFFLSASNSSGALPTGESHNDLIPTRLGNLSNVIYMTSLSKDNKHVHYDAAQNASFKEGFFAHSAAPGRGVISGCVSNKTICEMSGTSQSTVFGALSAIMLLNSGVDFRNISLIKNRLEYTGDISRSLLTKTKGGRINFERMLDVFEDKVCLTSIKGFDSKDLVDLNIERCKSDWRKGDIKFLAKSDEGYTKSIDEISAERIGPINEKFERSIDSILRIAKIPGQSNQTVIFYNNSDENVTESNYFGVHKVLVKSDTLKGVLNKRPVVFSVVLNDDGKETTLAYIGYDDESNFNKSNVLDIVFRL